MNSTKTVYHAEDVRDGSLVNVLTSNDSHYNKVSAGICVENQLLCLLLAEKGKREICVPLCDIKEIEILE